MEDVSTAVTGEVTLRTIEPADAADAAQIIFDAFGEIQDHHRLRGSA